MSLVARQMSFHEPVRQEKVKLSVLEGELRGTLSIPENPKGLVLFAHGSGSSRLSPRNQKVAQGLNDNSLATLLVDLLCEHEEGDRQKVFDIPFLAKRLIHVIEWIDEHAEIKVLNLGIFGASTGAAVALELAAMKPDKVRAVVSRGGRPDLALDILPLVKCPTLFIVGGYDLDVLELNKKALQKLDAIGIKELKIVPGASHLFEESGKLEEMAELAEEWFERYLK